MNKIKLFLFFLVSSMSAFIIPLINFHSEFYARDWGLFNSLSYFNKSSWLHYKTFPIHNPYMFGGADILADPQSRVFSPLSVFDLLLDAPYANLISLLCLSMIGAYGMYKLLNHLKMDQLLSLSISFLFAHASWFALHFAEGHIIFGSFQLIGLVLYFTLRIYEPKYKVYLVSLLAFMIVDGGFYAFIYSLLLIFFSFLFRLNSLSFLEFLKSIIPQLKHVVLSLFIFIGIAGAKLIPFLSLHGGREPILENILLDFKSILHSFFLPNQHVLHRFPGASFREYGLSFHEVGAYIGVLSFVIIIYFLYKRMTRQFVPYLLFVVLFFWIGTGIGGQINPWVLFQKIPVVNNAHIQTRALFIVYFILIILLAYALQFIHQTKGKKLYIGLIAILVIESLCVSNYAHFKLYEDSDSLSSSIVFDDLMNHTRVDQTVKGPAYFNDGEYLWGHDFDLFLHENTASKTFMDPAVVRGEIKTIDDPGYRGEVYFLEGKGEIDVLSYTPKSLDVQLMLDEKSKIQFNTNFLLGWKSLNPEVLVSNENGLLTIQIPETGKYKLTLKYSPGYLSYILIGYIFSICLLLVYIYWINKKSLLIKSNRSRI